MLTVISSINYLHFSQQFSQYLPQWYVSEFSSNSQRACHSFVRGNCCRNDTRAISCTSWSSYWLFRFRLLVIEVSLTHPNTGLKDLVERIEDFSMCLTIEFVNNDIWWWLGHLRRQFHYQRPTVFELRVIRCSWALKLWAQFDCVCMQGCKISLSTVINHWWSVSNDSEEVKQLKMKTLGLCWSYGVATSTHGSFEHD